jgi:hypothetical protein
LTLQSTEKLKNDADDGEEPHVLDDDDEHRSRARTREREREGERGREGVRER